MAVAQQKTHKKRRKSKHAKAVEKAFKIPAGWDTTDEDEIKRRQHRAETETMTVATLESDIPYFGTYTVFSASKKAYTVEVRCLLNRINNCSCADYETNDLGTCKHIEKVLRTLEKKGKRKYQAAGMVGSPRAEIYVNPQTNLVTLAWPQEQIADLKSHRLLNDFFSADGSLIADAKTTIPVLKRLVHNSSETVRKNTRLSYSLDRLLEGPLDCAQKKAAKEFFLQDVADGKRSLALTKLPLYDYQTQGLLHLAFGERAILADEMGLGKTVQAVAACELLRKLKGIERVLVISPTSLKAEWEEQIAKFTNLSTELVYGPREARLRSYQKPAFFYLTNYEQILRDREDIQRIIAPDVIILDEAQRIKNWRTKTANTMKDLHSRYAFVLTGTPIENRIDDLYSIVQFLDPKFFGSLFRFNREFYELDDKGKAIGYKNLHVLHERVKPILMRRLKSDVEGELPDRTVNTYFVEMSPEQQKRYEDHELIVSRLAHHAAKRALSKEEFERMQKALAAMRMLCDTPYILDEACRTCPKLHELERILEELMQDPDTKIIIFSEWQRMLMLVRELLEKMGIGYAWHTGSVDQRKRREEINRFKDDSNCQIFLSTDSGSVGLNLQAANVVINLDLPWNPAKLEQRIARAWRKHQTRTVQVINLVSENTIEHRMMGLLRLKQDLADSVLDSGMIETMKLPSGRAAFIKQINEITGAKFRIAEKVAASASKDLPPTEDPLTTFQQETLARFKPRLQQLDAYENDNGQKTVLAVVDGDSAHPQQKMQASLKEIDPEQALQLEVLDQKTYETIQRLCKAGILSFNQSKASLYRSQPKIASEQELRRQRAKQAQKILSKTERKQRMATLLIDGEFYQEAYTPLKEVFELTIKSFATLSGVTGKDISVTTIEQELVHKAGLPPEAITLAEQFEAKEISDKKSIDHIAETTAKLCEFVAEEIR